MSIAANTASLPLVSTAKDSLTAVRFWLFSIAALVFAMIIVGGATRLTGSGLSITEWQPILGAIPPLSGAAWQDAFAKYREIPQAHLVNPDMTLAGFKAIYWWEWAHRFLGRLIGFVFLLPFVYFLARRAIPGPFIPKVAALFILGGAQGALGWFMVKSGLADRVDVSQYRLAAHLALAAAIGAYAFWLGLSLVWQRSRMLKAAIQPSKPMPLDGRLKGLPPARTGGSHDSNALRISLAGLILCGLIYLQIIMGAFVAGLHGGHASDTWPLMNGEIVPPGVDVYSPWWLNLFENPLTAQFAHRMLAYLVAMAVLAFTFAAWLSPSLRAERSNPEIKDVILDRHCGQGSLATTNGSPLLAPALAMLGAVALQIALGVATIVYDVPIGLALAHQANAIVLFTLSLWTLRRTIRRDDASQ